MTDRGLIASAALLATTVAGNALNAAGHPMAAIPIFLIGVTTWLWLLKQARRER